MEKLLHTRLSNYSKQCFSSNRIQEIEGTIHIGDLLDKWAAEIERYYVPRPRFEDGTPMHLGDMCDFGDYFDKDERVKEIFGLHYVNDGDWSIQPLNESYRARLDNCKRPPKVLDADGVPYKRGETIYGIESGDAFEVLNPNKREGYMEARELQGKREICEIKPQFYTHERPVFDAEGVRICKGDTVWSTDPETSENAKVVNFNNDSDYCVGVRWSDGLPDYVKPNYLIHHEPDSIEKVALEMLEYIDGKYMYTAPRRLFRDRLEKLGIVERDA